MPDSDGASARPSEVDRLLNMIADQNKQVIHLLGTLSKHSTSTARPIYVNIEKYDESVETYDDYIGRLESFFKTQLLSEQSKADTFITLLSPKHHALLKSLIDPSELSSKTYNELKDQLKQHLNPTSLVIPSRHTFLNRKQFEGESISQFASELRKLAAKCKYPVAMLDTMLRDVFVSGLRSRVMLDRLFEEDDITLDKSLQIALALEKVTEGTTEILSPLSVVHKMNRQHVNNRQVNNSTSMGEKSQYYNANANHHENYQMSFCTE